MTTQRSTSFLTSLLCTAALAGALVISFSGPAAAGAFSAMVADVKTGTILTADQIDAPRRARMISRLTTITMGIQDLADETLEPDEDLDVSRAERVDVMTALQATALGEEGYRAPMTALAARIGYNAKLFEERMRALRSRAGLQATEVKVVRGEDGGPGFEGRTTTRDLVRMATSLLRAHGPATREVFGPATGFLETTHIWMSDKDMCLLAAEGPRTRRLLIAALTGAPDDAACFEAAARLLAEQDLRVLTSR